MLIEDLITFHHLVKLPAGHDVGDAAFGLDAHDAHFRDELAVAAHEEDAVRDDVVFFAQIEDDEIPLGIDDQHLALGAGGKRNFHRFEESVISSAWDDFTNFDWIKWASPNGSCRS